MGAVTGRPVLTRSVVIVALLCVADPVVPQHAALVEAVGHFARRSAASQQALGVHVLLVQPPVDRRPLALQGVPGPPEVEGRREDVPADGDLLVVETELLPDSIALLLRELLPCRGVRQQGLLPGPLVLEPAQTEAVGVVHNVDAVPHMSPRNVEAVVAER